jgi:hypothetical protein
MSKKLDPKVAEKVMLKAGLTPLEPYKNVDSKWKCKHKTCGRIVYPTYSNVKYGFGPCRKCGIKSGAKKRTIQSKKAINLMIQNNLEPVQPYKSAKKRWKCVCKICGKTVYPTYNKIQQGRGGCRSCGIEIRVEKSRTPETFAVKQMLEAKLRPIEAYRSANKIWKCECLRCGRIVTPTYSGIQQGRGGCKHCGGNFLDPKDAKKLMVASGYKPLLAFKNVHANWKSIHLPCGNTVYPQYSQIQQGFGGCRHCAKWGYQYDKESYIYLITHPQLESHKIGIANTSKLKKNDRLHRHQKGGWLVFKTWYFEEGRTVEKIEKEVFRILRSEMRIKQHLSRSEMRYAGETETISADSITLLELEKIIKKVIKGYKQ